MKKTPMQSFNKIPLCPPTCQIIKVLTLTLILIGLLLPQAKSQTPTLVLSNKWTISSANRTDVAISGNTERGIAINPFTGNVLLASRAGSNHVAVIKGSDGSDLGALDNSVISGGTLGLMHVRVADDGAVYACNLSAGSTSNLKIYRWNSE